MQLQHHSTRLHIRDRCHRLAACQLQRTRIPYLGRFTTESLLCDFSQITALHPNESNIVEICIWSLVVSIKISAALLNASVAYCDTRSGELLGSNTVAIPTSGIVTTVASSLTVFILLLCFAWASTDVVIILLIPHPGVMTECFASLSSACVVQTTWLEAI